MAITEVATFALKAGSNINDKNSIAGQLWQDIRGTILRQDGCIDLYIGSGVESPDVAQLFVNWDKYESHKKFMESTEYGPMVQRWGKILDGDPEFLHIEFTNAGALTSALSAPVTELATFYMASYTSSFDKKFQEFSTKVQGTDGSLGLTYGWSLEDVVHDNFEEGKTGKAVMLAVGWQSIDAHMAFRETEKFKEVTKFMMDEPKGAEVHHVVVQTTE